MDLLKEFKRYNEPVSQQNQTIPLKEMKESESKTPLNQPPLDYVLYKSHLLDGEKVLVVRDATLLAKYKQEFAGVVIYTPVEIDALYRFNGDVDAVKKIHFAKKTFEGRLMRYKEVV